MPCEGVRVCFFFELLGFLVQIGSLILSLSVFLSVVYYFFRNMLSARCSFLIDLHACSCAYYLLGLVHRVMNNSSSW